MFTSISCHKLGQISDIHFFTLISFLHQGTSVQLHHVGSKWAVTWDLPLICCTLRRAGTWAPTRTSPTFNRLINLPTAELVSFVLSTFDFRLSTFDFQLSTFNFKFANLNFQLSFDNSFHKLCFQSITGISTTTGQDISHQLKDSQTIK